MGNEVAAERLRCRVCDSSHLTKFIDMGDMPLANGLLDSPYQPEHRYPLRVNYCNQCGLVQLSHVVPAQTLYENYAFQTGTSIHMGTHFATQMALEAAQYVEKGVELIVEIGSNDGSALYGAKQHGHRVLGVDPARNLANCAATYGVPTFCEYFGRDVGRAIAEDAGQAHLIVACNVLGHVDDLNDFMRGVVHLLHDDGAFVFEVPYLGDTIRGGHYDQFYHEHLSYFSLAPLALLMERHGLRIETATKFPVHGGSIRCVCHKGPGGASARVQSTIALDEQYERSLYSLSTFQGFAIRCEADRHNLKSRIMELVNDGKQIIAYGASAKGAVVLNWADVGVDVIPFVIDSTPAKQSRYMPGTHQYVVKAEWAMGQGVGDHDPPDVMLLLAWNHVDEIKAKHPEFTGEWIVPHEL